MNLWITSWLDMNRLLISWPTFIWVILPVPPLALAWRHTHAQRIGRKWTHTQSAWTKIFLIFIEIREQDSTADTTLRAVLITNRYYLTPKTSEMLWIVFLWKAQGLWIVSDIWSLYSLLNSHKIEMIQRERVKKIKWKTCCYAWNLTKQWAETYVHFSAHPIH